MLVNLSQKIENQAHQNQMSRAVKKPQQKILRNQNLRKYNK